MYEDLVSSSGRPARVLIVGGGVAALEALLALRELAEERVTPELVAPGARFSYKPLAVAEPFGFGKSRTYELAGIAEDVGAEMQLGEVSSVESERRRVRLADGGSIEYDALVVAVGARASNPLPGSVVVQGPGYTSHFSTLLRKLERRELHRVVFVVPSINSWALPLYELALMTAARVAERKLRKVELKLLTPEAAPLDVFGPDASAAVAALLSERGVELLTDRTPLSREPEGVAVSGGGVVSAEAVVGLPRLEGPRLEGLPADPEGFIPVDDHGLVEGEVDVYAAGDATTFPLKQGGLATQQADAVAESIAARAGAPVTPEPFRPVLRGMLLTGGVPRYLRSEPERSGDRLSEVADYALWWPPAKIAGRRLSPYLARRGEDLAGEAPGAEGVPVEVELERQGRAGVRRRVVIAPSSRGGHGVAVPYGEEGR